MNAKKLPDIVGRDERGEYNIPAPNYPQIDWGYRDCRDSKYERVRTKIFISGFWRVAVLTFLLSVWVPVFLSFVGLVLFLSMVGIGCYADYAAKEILKEEADAKYLKACQEFEQLRKKIADESKKFPVP